MGASISFSIYVPLAVFRQIVSLFVHEAFDTHLRSLLERHEDHLDLGGLVRLARTSALADDEDRADANRALAKKLEDVRRKSIKDLSTETPEQ